MGLRISCEDYVLRLFYYRVSCVGAYMYIFIDLREDVCCDAKMGVYICRDAQMGDLFDIISLISASTAITIIVMSVQGLEYIL